MKKQPLYKRYSEEKPVGVVSFCNTFGVQVYEPQESEKYNCDFICCWCNGENKWGYHTHKIHYSATGRAYLRKGSMRIYLDEIIRVD